MKEVTGIAKNIKALREHHDISQVELAKMLDVTDRAISAWETGIKEPRIKNIRKIAEIFNVPPSKIMDGDLETYYKSKTSPTPAQAEAEEVEKWLTDLLVERGYIRPGEDISDRDAEFLIHWIGILDAWFEKE